MPSGSDGLGHQRAQHRPLLAVHGPRAAWTAASAGVSLVGGRPASTAGGTAMAGCDAWAAGWGCGLTEAALLRVDRRAGGGEQRQQRQPAAQAGAGLRVGGGRRPRGFLIPSGLQGVCHGCLPPALFCAWSQAAIFAFIFHPRYRYRMTTQNTPEDTAVRCARDCANCAPTAGKPAQPWRSADARKAVHLAERRPRRRQGGPPRASPSWPRSGPWRTNPTCARCSSNGWKPASPWCCRWCERNAPLAFLPWTPDAPMRSGAYGIQEPAAGDELPPDVVLAPTLGFTQFGDRGLRRRLLRPHAGAARRRPALHRHRHRLELRRAGRRLRAGRTRLPAGRHPDRGRLGARGAAVATRQGRQDVVFYRLG